jgi:hypothetical protein
MQNLVFSMTLFKGMHILVIGKEYVPVAAGSKGTIMVSKIDASRLILNSTLTTEYPRYSTYHLGHGCGEG